MTGSKIVALRASALILAGAGLSLAAGAGATIIETSTMTNSYSYTVGSLSGSNANAPGNVGLFLSDSAGGFQSDLGLALTASLDKGSFFFLQNGYCVGSCSLSLTTDITFQLTNTGPAAADLSFQSLITPGHLAQSNLVGTNAAQKGVFGFTVAQDGRTLYRADGFNSNRPPQVDTANDVPFNNEVKNVNLPLWNVTDWSATPLVVDLLTIGAGQTSTLVYHSRIDVVTTNTACPDTTNCLGYQVAFGDPRSLGGATGFATLGPAPLSHALALPTASQLLSAPPSPAVGALYDPYNVTYSFVPQGATPPQPPIGNPPITYDIPYKGGAVPEPESWALMLLGFAAVGATIRRRRQADKAVCA